MLVKTDAIFFSDIDLNFKPHPLTGDVPVKINAYAIRQAILNLFFLEKYDVPFNMDACSNIRNFLFDSLNIITASSIQVRLEWLLKKYETRIILEKLSVKTNINEDRL